MIQAGRLNMLMPLDLNVIDDRCSIRGSFATAKRIGGHTLSMVLCYNKKKWPGEDHPNSWADFWNVEKFPGRRVLRREALWTMEAALKADGVKDSDFYPIDVERAFRSLDRIKPHVKAWCTDNSLGAAADGAGGGRPHRDDEWPRHRDDPATAKAPYRDRLERGDLRRRHPGLDGAERLSKSPGRDEISRYRRAAGIRGGLRAAACTTGRRIRRPMTCSSPDIAKLMPTYPANEKVAHMVNYDWWADKSAGDAAPLPDLAAIIEPMS